MILAHHEGQPIRATLTGPRTAGCRDCGAAVHAKTGHVITHHWAHYPNRDQVCASADTVETEWHRTWKARCADDTRIEVAVDNRRADVLTTYRWSIEFQHSNQTPQQIAARRRDWRGRLIWCFDELELAAGGVLKWGRPEGRRFVTIELPRHRRETLLATRTPTFIHVAPDTVLYLGHRHRTIRDDLAYGWPLTVAEFTTAVIDGGRPPRHPTPYHETPDLDLWARPYDADECPELVYDGVPGPDWPVCACGNRIFYLPGQRTRCARCAPVRPLRTGDALNKVRP